MLDGPYANSTWNGKEVGRIEVKNPKRGQRTTHSVAVPQVEGLSGKHAIYIVVEGPEVAQPQQQNRWGRSQQASQRPYGLCDLHGIAFASRTQPPAAPKVPQVRITIDGQALTIPAAAILSTNLNGYTQTNHYQLYGRLTEKSVIKAESDDPSVTFQVSPISSGRAKVIARYKKQDKVFLIN